MNRRCVAKDCTSDAHIGVQLIRANDERQDFTQWLCMPHLSAGLRQLASTVDMTAAAVVLAGLLGDDRR